MKAKYSNRNCKESNREKKINPVFMPLYQSVQCPHLEHCVQFWSPISEKYRNYNKGSENKQHIDGRSGMVSI